MEAGDDGHAADSPSVERPEVRFVARPKMGASRTDRPGKDRLVFFHALNVDGLDGGVRDFYMITDSLKTV